MNLPDSVQILSCQVLHSPLAALPEGAGRANGALPLAPSVAQEPTPADSEGKPEDGEQDAARDRRA